MCSDFGEIRRHVAGDETMVDLIKGSSREDEYAPTGHTLAGSRRLYRHLACQPLLFAYQCS